MEDYLASVMHFASAWWVYILVALWFVGWQATMGVGFFLDDTGLGTPDEFWAFVAVCIFWPFWTPAALVVVVCRAIADMQQRSREVMHADIDAIISDTEEKIKGAS